MRFPPRQPEPTPPSPGYEAPPRAIDSQAPPEGYGEGTVDALNLALVAEEAREAMLAEGRALALAEHKCVVTVADLAPFNEVLAEVARRVRATGGGVQDAYAQCERMLRNAIGQYRTPDDLDV